MFYKILYRIRDSHTNERIGFLLRDNVTGSTRIANLEQALMLASSSQIEGVKVSTVNEKPMIVSIGDLKLSDIPEITENEARFRAACDSTYKIVYRIHNDHNNTVGFILYNLSTKMIEAFDYEIALKLAMERKIQKVGYIRFPNNDNKCYIASSPNSPFQLSKVPSIHYNNVDSVISKGVPYDLIDKLYTDTSIVRVEKRPTSSIMDELDKEFIAKLRAAEEKNKNKETIDRGKLNSKGIFGIFNAFKR